MKEGRRKDGFKAVSKISLAAALTLLVALIIPAVAMAAPSTYMFTQPAAPDGDNGWFKTVPTISLFTTSDAVSTLYKFDTMTVDWQLYAGSFAAPEGPHMLMYYSVDASANAEATHYAFLATDISLPANPSLASPSHTVGGTSADNTIDITLSGAFDAVSGVQGYATSWSQGSPQVPGSTVNLTAGATTSPPLAAGAWYFNLKTKDLAGNWAAAVNIGPFNIQADDTQPPTTVVSTAPATPDGQNSWFKTVPSITLAADEPGVTYYQWDSTSPGGWQVYPGPFAGPQGEHALLYYSQDGAGNAEAVKSQAFKVDSVAPSVPSVNAPTYSTSVSAGTNISVSWTSSDPSPSSGGVGYDVQYKVGADGAYVNWRMDTTGTGSSFVGAPGNTYYFRGSAKDAAGNITAWSADNATVFPYDQEAAAFSGSWTTVSNSSLYMGTARYATSKTAYATHNSTGALEVSLIATRRPNGGKADVLIGGVKVATVDLYSPTVQYRVRIPVATYGTATSVQLRVNSIRSKNPASSGYRVELDGIGIKK